MDKQIPSDLPEVFASNMMNKLGSSFQDFYKSLKGSPPVSIRINPNKSSEIQGEPVAWSKFGKYLTERPVFTLDPAFHAGAYYVQEASSMFLEQVLIQHLNTNKPLHILDLCAAPGGKSTHILSLINQNSLLVANEVIRSRATILSENIQKWGNNNVVVTNNDPEDFRQLSGFFDVIVIDAPCSGEGLFRKDPEAIREWSPTSVELCSKRQRRILADVWPALKTGGILIYCTCTYNELENEENLKWLCEKHKTENIELEIGRSWGIEKTKMENLKGYRFYPHKVHGEGLFLSVVQKNEMQNKGRLKIKGVSPQLSNKTLDQLQEWVLKREEKSFFIRNETIHMVPKIFNHDIQFLLQHFKVVSAGTAMASLKHDKLVPEHTLALSIELNRNKFNSLDLTKEQALNYLRKESLIIETNQKGFSLVTYNNLALGWINILENRTNNMYPSNWRIRMAR